MSRYILNPYDRGPPDHDPPDPPPDCPWCGDPNTSPEGEPLDEELDTCGREECRVAQRAKVERLDREDAENDAASVQAELEFQAECAADPWRPEDARAARSQKP